MYVLDRLSGIYRVRLLKDTLELTRSMIELPGCE